MPHPRPQKNGPRQWNAYAPGVYYAMMTYLHAVSPKWDEVVAQVAEALRAVAAQVGTREDAADFFVAWANDRWTNAQTLLTQNMPPLNSGLTVNWVQMPVGP